MRIFVTGAAGFIGRAIVAECGARGHDVVAMVRPASELTQAFDAPTGAVTTVRGDLRRVERGWTDALAGSDAVIHCAYGQGDFFSQFAATVVGTENLLGAMSTAGVTRLVHLSTFSLYDYRATRAGCPLDEDAPLELHPELRDDYTRTKLVQEQLVREFEGRGGQVTVVRPGAVYGPSKLWDGGLTTRVFGDTWLAVAPNAKLKLVYVGNCAQAIVLAAEQPTAIGHTFNLVDDDPPTQRRYATLLRQHGVRVPRSVPVPYAVMAALAGLVDLVNRACFNGRARVPWFLTRAKLDARCKPFDYPNDRARDTLGWQPRFSLDDALVAVTDPAAATPLAARRG